MKLTAIFLTALCLGVNARSFSQSVTFEGKKVPLEKVLSAFQKQTGYSFFYNDADLPKNRRMTVSFKDTDLKSALDEILKGQDLGYTMQGRTIFIHAENSAGETKTSGAAYADPVHGNVTDSSSGEPLAGVTIKIKNSTSGTITDAEGSFTLDAPNDAVLQVSYLGYTSKEVALNGRDNIQITLSAASTGLNQLVVVGYGTQEKKNLTGSISMVSSEDIEKTKQHDLISILQGRAAGVQVSTSSGAPGGGMTIRVRGASSLNSGNSPLYIVDGIPLESNSLSQLNQDDPGINPLADINPDDIESIEVLKDAASTSIYGSRAANGVVLVTTKRGRQGKARIKLDVYGGFSKVPRELSVLNATQWRSAVLDSYRNMEVPETPHTSVVDSLNPKNNGDIDWQKAMFETAKQYSLNLSVSGGSQNLKYAWSTSYLDQDGILLNTNYKRITSRLNTDLIATDRLTIGQSIAYTNGFQKRVNSGGVGNKSLVRELLVRPPTYAMFLPDGSYNGYQNGQRNPVGLATLATNNNGSNRLTGSEYVEYKILEGLKVRSNLNLDYISLKENWFIPSTLDYREGWNQGSVRNTQNLTWGNETYLSFNKHYHDKHHVSAVAGLGFQRWKQTVNGLDGMFFASDRITTLNGAGTISNQQVNTASEHALRSYFGRISYDFEGRYLAEANLRSDGSSRFGANHRFGYFPSASLGWRFSDEDFMKKVSFVSDGKLRVSAGKTGNEAIGDYTAQGQFAVGANYLTHSGAAPTITSNADLTWESTTEYDLGVDLSLFNYRIDLSADVYLKKTSGLLFNVPIPLTTGFESVTRNVGNIENKGIEFSFTSHNMVGKFKWNSSFNISSNKNRITSLPSELLTNGYIQNGAYHILKVGEPIGTFYGYKFLGVYATDADNVKGYTYGANGPKFKGGEPIWYDANGDNIIDERDRVIIGDATPKFWGGLTNDFSYKGFSLSVFLQFVYGNDIYSEINHQRNSIVRYNNLSTDALKRWREPGDVTSFPKPVRDDPKESDSRIQDRWIEDGSYLKIKNVMFSYDFNKDLVSRLGLSSLQVYLTASDLLTFTNYTAYDPDVNSFGGIRPGVDYGTYPLSRSFFFGVKLGF